MTYQQTLEYIHRSGAFLTAAIVFALILIPLNGNSQGSRYIGGWGGTQFTGINNTSDHFAGDIKFKTTFGLAAGFTYLNQFETYGFRSGLVYSLQGQAYEGQYRDQNNREHNFNSHLKLEYIKIPALLNFRSLSNEAGTIDLDVYAGFQLGYLINAGMEVDPPIQGPTDNTPELTALYNNFDLAFSSGAKLNYWLQETYGLFLGLRMDRSLTNIEKQDFDFHESVPLEYHFPVSTKKSERPTADDYEIRHPSRNLTFSLQLGFQYRIGED